MKKRLLLLIVVSLLSAANLFAGKGYRYEDVKNIKKNYPCNQDVLLEVNNKYGNVNVQQWGRSEVQINISITVKANSEREVNRILEMINISFESSRSRVLATTNFQNNFNVKNASFSISYHVYVPRKASMGLINKYGNVLVGRCDGNFKSDVKYGNLQIDQLMSQKADMVSKYGNIKINGGKANDVQINIGYGNVLIERLQNLNITSRYGGLKAENIENLYVSAKYDNYEIERCSSINITEGGYTNFKINNLKSSFTADSGVIRYGSVKLGGLTSSLKKVAFDCSYTNVALTFSDAANYDFDLDLQTSYGNVKVSDEIMSRFRDKTITLNGRSSTGIKVESKSDNIIKIQNRYGDIKLN